MDWLWTSTPFVPFGFAHLAALALTVAVAMFAAQQGFALRGRPRQLWFSRVMAIVIFVFLGAIQTVSLAPANFDWESSLPLQLCDVAGFVAVFALWTYRQWPIGIVYYWGLTATLLAMITPDLRGGFPTFAFLKFFVSHAIVIVAAVYLCWGVGMRPSWPLYRQTCLLTIGYAALVYALNTMIGVNYVYLNRAADPGTLFDWFGPFPMHILVCTLIALFGWAALTWPWIDSSQRRASAD